MAYNITCPKDTRKQVQVVKGGIPRQLEISVVAGTKHETKALDRHLHSCIFRVQSTSLWIFLVDVFPSKFWSGQACSEIVNPLRHGEWSEWAQNNTQPRPGVLDLKHCASLRKTQKQQHGRMASSPQRSTYTITYIPAPPPKKYNDQSGMWNHSISLHPKREPRPQFVDG